MNYLLDVGGYKIRIGSDFSVKNKNDQIELEGGYVLKNMYDVNTFAEIVNDAERQADSALSRLACGNECYERIRDLIDRDDWQEGDLIGRPFTLELDIRCGLIYATVLTTYKNICSVGVGDYVEPVGPAEISDIQDFCEDNNIHIPKMLYQVVT